MKNKRQEMILEIIETMSVETQEELAEILKERNFSVTQPPSRGISKRLRLIKTLSDKGVYCYTVAERRDVRSQSAMIRLFSDVVVSVESTGNLVVVRTISGSASAAAEALDTMHFTETLRLHCGDNTIFLAVYEGVNVAELVKKLKRMAK
ncbi:MAG: arginine repressor [Christensenellales bacterium]